MSFTNEKRNRYYGLRIGDMVVPKGLNGVELKCGKCEVVEFALMDNNGVYLEPTNGDDKFPHVAEWCEMIKPVDGEEGWKKLEPVKYLGTFDVDETTNPYHDFTRENWVLHYVRIFGQYKGEHHKFWLLDQIARILNDTPVIVTEERWGNKYGVVRQEFDFNLGEPSEGYKQWVHEVREWDEELEEYLFDYKEGTCP